MNFTNFINFLTSDQRLNTNDQRPNTKYRILNTEYRIPINTFFNIYSDLLF
ncbi:MAG: hypothetical protein LBT27_04000 [Prevotellaceae bacterium]|nr:hypothetical protein [Prevotellaceae bacterium]